MKISQREARRLRKRVDELERQRTAERQTWGSGYPGIHLGSLSLEKDWFWGACKTARRLGRVLVVTVDDQGKYDIYAAK